MNVCVKMVLLAAMEMARQRQPAALPRNPSHEMPKSWSSNGDRGQTNRLPSSGCQVVRRHARSPRHLGLQITLQAQFSLELSPLQSGNEVSEKSS